MNLRDYVFLGTTHSLCPLCRRLVDAKIIVRAGRVYFRKRCPEHGLLEDLVCSDAAYYDRHEFSQPARAPLFDTRRVMKCCLAHLLPSGHVVPFCAYNTLYRDGHVPLPPLAESAPAQTRTLTMVT